MSRYLKGGFKKAKIYTQLYIRFLLKTFDSLVDLFKALKFQNWIYIENSNNYTYLSFKKKLKSLTRSLNYRIGFILKIQTIDNSYFFYLLFGEFLKA